MTRRHCKKCNQFKDISMFSKHHIRKDGTIAFRAQCKKCCWEKEKLRRDAKRTKIKQAYNHVINNSKICSKCKIDKPLENYRWIEKRKRIRSECIVCQKKYDTERRSTKEYKQKQQERRQGVKEKYRLYKRRAKKNNRNFTLSINDFTYLTRNKNCYLCNDFYKITTIDRINSKKGYEKGNCLPCCKKCNTIKLDMSLTNLYSHIEKILKNKPNF